MRRRQRIYYSVAQRCEIWDRWQAGEPISSIGRRFDRDIVSSIAILLTSNLCGSRAKFGRATDKPILRERGLV
jgi:hypothetical protein